MTEKKPTPDWERIERDYRAGVKTLRQIAEEHGISHVAINKRAKKEGWSRDLSGKIAAKAEELVTKEAVTKSVTSETKVTERQIVEANAQAIVAVRLGQRKDIRRARGLVMTLLEELEGSCGGDQVALLQQLGEMMRDPDQFGRDKLNDLYHAVIGLPGRAKTMKDLAESLSKLIDKERQAFGLDKDASEEDRAPALTDAQRASRLATLLAKARQAEADGS